MSDLMAKCDWYDGTLSVVLPEDPERIAVRMFDSRLAPARLYVPEVEILALRDENAKLRGFWTHDGTWHVELPKLPKGIAVTTTDERDREVRTARVWRYVREDEAENDRLRELLTELYEEQCDECDRWKYRDRMRELGVEVD